MDRARVTYPLLIGILLGSSLPILVLVQFLLDRGGRGETWLEGQLAVRQEGAPPLLYNAALTPSSPGALSLNSTSKLLQSAFPWEPTEVQASLSIRLSSTVFTQADRDPAEGWWASYRERDTTRADGLGVPPLPCEGRIVVTESKADGSPISLGDLDTLDLAVDLLCTSAGPDLLWHTGDERTWSLEGPLSLRRGRR